MDKINFTFQELAAKELPRLLTALNDAKAYSISDLLGEGSGVATALKTIGKTEDFAGLYIFIDPSLPTNEQVIYTGISRIVVRRLNQHIKVGNHNSASFAYKIAHKTTAHTGKRIELSQLHIQTEQTYLKGLQVKFIEIQNPLERYIFEAYVAMHFNTAFNTFETS